MTVEHGLCSSGQWLWEDTSDQEVVRSNTRWISILSYLFVTVT